MGLATIRKKIDKLYNKGLNMFACYMCRPGKIIVFDSYKGKQYSDNPRSISEKMHEMYPDYKLVWGVQKDVDLTTLSIPEYIETYPINSWRYRICRASAFAYVRNEAMTNDLHKRKGQKYIQTWHGDRGIKKILYDSLQARNISSNSFGYADEYMTDLFVIGSDYAKKRIKTAFRYHGETIDTGCPRNDCLINPIDVEKIKARIGICSKQKILLYAPTLRRNRKIVKGTVDVVEVLAHLNAKGEDWVCLVRAHPKSLGLEVKQGNNIIDVSRYPDMADLLMVADCLITDYSSCSGDFILKKKPMILAQFDLQQYIEEDRTFYVDINQIGFLIAHDQKELNDIIDNTTEEQFADNCETVLKFFGTTETGHASKDVCEWIDMQYNFSKA